MQLRSDTGVVTAEFAVALPSVLMVLAMSMSALMVPVQRIELVFEAANLARAASRGEAVAGAQVSGKFVCVTKASSGVFEFRETQCARRLGL